MVHGPFIPGRAVRYNGGRVAMAGFSHPERCEYPFTHELYIWLSRNSLDHVPEQCKAAIAVDIPLAGHELQRVRRERLDKLRRLQMPIQLKSVEARIAFYA